MPTMQTCSITLRLGGSLLHTVQKIGVTPAEILVLQNIHGSDAVVDVRATRSRLSTHAAEWDRLAALYDKASTWASPEQNAGSVLSKLFPGAMRKLPLTLAEIGIEVAAPPEDVEQEPVELETPQEEVSLGQAMANG